MWTQANAKTLFLTVAGTQFAYRLIGNSTPAAAGSPPLLLLNHFRSTIDLWDPLLVDGIAAGGRQVITYDYSGIGLSGGEVKLSIREFAGDVIAFLTSLLPTLPNNVTNVDVLGFSIGGYVAQQLVLDAPDLVNKLVLAGTGPSGSLGTPRHPPMAEVQTGIMGAVPDGAATADAFFPSFTARDEGNAWLGRITAGGRAATAGKNGEPPFAFFLTGPGLPRLIRAYLGWDADPLPYALLQTVQKPVLVTAGDNDLVVGTPNSFELARQIPNANFVMFPSSGHGHLFQYAEFYAKQVTSFLNGEFPTAPKVAGVIAPLGSQGV
ncbi:Alpha/Beta hydrolase protein [Lasiosphaeria miniovina]|uniref:Alpha/Beta hydrolase protein n=1 Tax=Lasiosphaeria miniovina TaxID=1954250 RepID=A0AA40E1A7_9PEZI|nr:Alpha/Beta hydrolase protein [Lasiosphaeria miniovina]KAK0723350.1 Alpha/Beta hydrolase protein [Lasiosphaeria miniovina]